MSQGPRPAWRSETTKSSSPYQAPRAALRAFFGGADLGYSVDDLADPDGIIQLGLAPVRIDLTSAIPGCPDFTAAWARRVDAPFGAAAAHYLGLDDLIRAKRATDRLQDRADVRVLERARRQRRR